MRPGEFWEALGAYRKEQALDRRHAGELARGAALRLFNIQLRVQDRIKDPSQFWAMPWDETPEGVEVVKQLNDLTDTERDAAVKEFLERIKK